MILTRDGTAILLKKPQSYWYYFYKNHNCRVSIKNLWNLLDTSSITVSYGSELKNRRKKKKQRTLDLHGVKHSDAEEKIRRFLNFIELPAVILTGDSYKMKKIVEGVVSQYGWYCSYNSSNFGKIIILENSA